MHCISLIIISFKYKVSVEKSQSDRVCNCNICASGFSHKTNNSNIKIHSFDMTKQRRYDLKGEHYSMMQPRNISNGKQFKGMGQDTHTQTNRGCKVNIKKIIKTINILGHRLGKKLKRERNVLK